MLQDAGGTIQCRQQAWAIKTGMPTHHVCHGHMRLIAGVPLHLWSTPAHELRGQVAAQHACRVAASKQTRIWGGRPHAAVQAVLRQLAHVVPPADKWGMQLELHVRHAGRARRVTGQQLALLLLVPLVLLLLLLLIVLGLGAEGGRLLWEWQLLCAAETGRRSALRQVLVPAALGAQVQPRRLCCTLQRHAALWDHGELVDVLLWLLPHCQRPLIFLALHPAARCHTQTFGAAPVQGRAAQPRQAGASLLWRQVAVLF